jgi:phosphoribosyl 1,2-cyclic phosphodiesterase
VIESGEGGGDAIGRFIEKKDPRSLKLVHLHKYNGMERERMAKWG